MPTFFHRFPRLEKEEFPEAARFNPPGVSCLTGHMNIPDPLISPESPWISFIANGIFDWSKRNETKQGFFNGILIRIRQRR